MNKVSCFVDTWYIIGIRNTAHSKLSSFLKKEKIGIPKFFIKKYDIFMINCSLRNDYIKCQFEIVISWLGDSLLENIIFSKHKDIVVKIPNMFLIGIRTSETVSSFINKRYIRSRKMLRLLSITSAFCINMFRRYS